MGVQDLWSIVEPVRESVPLYSLSGKTLAVDLSLWVCEAQHVQAMMGRVSKPHLRNLFFRVSSLTLMGVKLVFVMEGEAPKLKAETMNRRNQNRRGGFKQTAPRRAAPTGRGRFNAVLRECAEMLDYLGVPWVTAAGEAEAMCAYLDSQGLVDGCITNDGDAFLYGAQTVYRNFNMNTKDPQVDCYRTARVHSELCLSRENLVGLAILLGCDYIPKGIPGVGKEQAVRLINTLNGQSLLQRFKQWKVENLGEPVGAQKKVPHCQICRHPGSAKAHERGGCILCASDRFCQPQDFDYQCPCDWHRGEQSRQASSLEANVRKRVLSSDRFPFTEIITEFLVSKDKPAAHFRRRQPNILLIQKFAFDKLEWPRHYTCEKVLVLMTYAELMNRTRGRETSSQIQPLRILKPRVRNGVSCYEVIWTKPEHYVYPDDHPAEKQQEVSTVEEESLFRSAFPEVVERYLRERAEEEEEKRSKKRKPRTKNEKPVDTCEDISALLGQMVLHSSDTHPQPQQRLPVAAPKSDEMQVVLDSPSPAHHRQQSSSTGGLGKEDEDKDRRPDPATSSPSVSVVLQALHLSDIDWDSASFTSSPPPPASEEAGAAGGHEIAKQRSSSSTDGAEVGSPELGHAERPLRDRLLLRNATKCATQQRNSDKNIQLLLNYDSGSPERTSASDPKSKPAGETSERRRELEPERTQQTTSAAAGRLKPPQKYQITKMDAAVLLVPKRRCFSDPSRGPKDRKAHASKRSVCARPCPSSDDSDAENQQPGLRRHARSKAATRAAPPREGAPAPGLLPLGTKPRSRSENDGLDLDRAKMVGDVKRTDDAAGGGDLQMLAPPIIISDSDDSVISCDSPLPLAERLRLKLQH